MSSSEDGGNSRLVIVCEGEGDRAFFLNLMATRGLQEFRVIIPSDKPDIPGGVDGFARRLRALRAERDFDKIAGILVVSDNDDQPDGSFTKVQRQLTDSGGYPIPARPLEVARSLSGPPVAVMMLPRTGQPGSLETLCVEAMQGAWPEVARCVDEFCRCTSTGQWAPSKQSKMRLRAMVSAICESDPNTGLPYAWSRRENLIPLNEPVFDEIGRFLNDFKRLIAHM